jgi:hypothetical protein
MNIKHFSAIGLAALLAALSGCASLGGKPASPSASSIEQSCKDFCQHAQALKCPEGEPLPDGTTCTTFCIATEKAGHDLNTGCRIQAKDCAQLAKCP